MVKPHKHSELIKLWADGAEIEFHCPTRGWLQFSPDNWHPDDDFRIKPEPKPDVVKEITIQNAIDGIFMSEKQHFLANLKLTFDGETGELKSAEVLK